MITLLLTKLPWLASALGFFKNKTRLVIEWNTGQKPVELQACHKISP